METAYYGRITVLRGVSLTVPEGAAVAVLGSNGAGKTTLLRTISGLIDGQPQKGEVRWDGRSITRREPEEVARLGIAHVPEGRGLFPELTVEENLALGEAAAPARPASGVAGRGGGEGRQAWRRRVFELFPVLAERRRQLAGTLSGGEQQMLAIARALVAMPRLMLLDEPSLGLAPMVVREIFRAIDAIRRQGTGILLVEQNAHMALKVADYGYVLENGRIVLEGPAEELAANPHVQELYLGHLAEPAVKGWRRYRKRRRWN